MEFNIINSKSLFDILAYTIFLLGFAISTTKTIFKGKKPKLNSEKIEKQSDLDEISGSDYNLIVSTYIINFCVAIILITCVVLYFLIETGYHGAYSCNHKSSFDTIYVMVLGIGFMLEAAGDLITKKKNRLLTLILQNFKIAIFILYLPAVFVFMATCS